MAAWPADTLEKRALWRPGALRAQRQDSFGGPGRPDCGIHQGMGLDDPGSACGKACWKNSASECAMRIWPKPRLEAGSPRAC